MLLSRPSAARARREIWREFLDFPRPARPVFGIRVKKVLSKNSVPRTAHFLDQRLQGSRHPPKILPRSQGLGEIDAGPFSFTDY
jgi:hypothetical protein